MEHIKDIETREEMYLKIPKGGIGAEIGVCKGMNAINLFFLCRPTTMFLIDVWCELNEPHGSDPKLWFTDHSVLISKIFEKEIEQGTVVTHKGFAVDWLCALPDNTLDWIYLDAYHEYDLISTELALAIDKVKRGGYIMGHDYRCMPMRFGSSVIRAVNERIQNGDIKMEAITLEEFPSYLTLVL